MNIKEIDQKYVAGTYARFDVVFKYGIGSTLVDENGKKYTDLGGGIAVTSFGIADKEWEKAVMAQVRALQHVSNLYYTKPQAELAQLLCEKTGMKKVFFSNSGAEANECAIKAARKYSADKYSADRNMIITLKGSFHGRTIATLTATGQDSFHKDFGPLPQGFDYAQPNDIADMKRLIAENNCCAIMIELIQGEGGINVLERDYVQEISKLCKENDILLIVDEVQTGNGRTGKLYCYMNYEIEPDILSTAKGLGGGLPIGATMFNKKTESVLGAGSHGSTFGGNPVCAAGALSIVERIDSVLMRSVKEKGDYIFSQFEGAKGVKSVSGMGLMIGIETVRDTKEVAAKCLERGVVVLTAKNKVRLLPALNIPFDELKEAVKVVKEVMKQ
ncbi:MAG TPA: aspartate aminotransferase family protein [Clostridia bacterium]|nr:aspartate aminotransferase family protein [Clostridia bacterium]